MNQIIAETKWHGDTKPWFTKKLWFYTISALFVIIEKKKMGKTNCLDKGFLLKGPKIFIVQTHK